jgi:hypothetical protein
LNNEAAQASYFGKRRYHDGLGGEPNRAA